jgi:hypothetical protein
VQASTIGGASSSSCRALNGVVRMAEMAAGAVASAVQAANSDVRMAAVVAMAGIHLATVVDVLTAMTVRVYELLRLQLHESLTLRLVTRMRRRLARGDHCFDRAAEQLRHRVDRHVGESRGGTRQATPTPVWLNSDRSQSELSAAWVALKHSETMQ